QFDFYPSHLPSFPTRRSSDLGYLALSYELLWFRVYLMAKGALGSCFALLLGTYLLALAAGAWLSRRFCRERASADAPKYFRLIRSEEHTSELQSLTNLVCRLL